MAAAAHRIVIDCLATRARIGAGDPERARARLSPVLAGPMPRAFGQAAEALFGDRNAVIRIRHLAVRVLDPEMLAGAALADRMARALTEALAQALAQGSRDTVRVWPDTMAYRASYAMMRLGLVVEPDWAFPDFAAYRHLTGPEAALTVLEPGGVGVMMAVAQALATANRTAMDLARKLDAPTSQILLGLIASTEVSTGQSAALMDRLIAAWHKNSGVGTPTPRAFAALIDSLDPTATAPVEVDDVPKLASLALVLANIAEMMLQPEIAAELPAAVRVGQIPAGKSRATVKDWLARSLETATLRDRLADFAEALRTGDHQPDQKMKSDADFRTKPPPAPVPVSSQLAGLALLLPLIPALGLQDAGPPETLRAIAMAALDLELDGPAARDPGLALLCPADPRLSVRPPDHAPPADAWRVTGSLGGLVRRDGPPLAAWCDLWLAGFAARLPGLHDSTREYLRRQFLHRPGRIQATDRQVTVTLSPMPLGIVLRMAGLLGGRGPLAHLGDRQLIIEMEQDR